MEDALNAAGFSLPKSPVPVPAAEGLLDENWKIVEANARLAGLLNTSVNELPGVSLLGFFPGLDQLFNADPQQTELGFVSLSWSDSHLFHICQQGKFRKFLLHSHGDTAAVEQCRRCRVFAPQIQEDPEIEQECMRLLGQLMSRMEVPFTFFHLVDNISKQISLTYWLGHGQSHATVREWRQGETVSYEELPLIATALERTSPAGGVGDARQGYWWSEPVIHQDEVVAVIGGVSSSPILGDRKALLERYGTLVWLLRQVPLMDRKLTEQSARIDALEAGNHKMFRQLINVVSEALELKDAYTANHQRSVAELAVGIGRRMGYHAHRLEGLRLGALVHDIGKLAIPNQILSKPGRLTEQEYALVQTHPVRGANIIGDVAFPWPIKQMILQHHERLDGSGYPYGLKGEQILEEAQILAVADIADSMLSHRPYRPALGLNALKAVLLDQREIGLRADIVDHCLDELSHSQRAVTYVSELPLRPVLGLCIQDALSASELLAMVSSSHEPYVALHNRDWLGVWELKMLRRHLRLATDLVSVSQPTDEIFTLPSNTSLEEGIRALSEHDHPLLVVDASDHALGVLDWKSVAQR